MKKFMKLASITLLSFIVLSSGIIYLNRGKLLFVKSLIDTYTQFDNTSQTTFTTSTESCNLDKDVVYSSYNGQQQTLDIYKPTVYPEKGSPVIIYVHGGSWIYGDNNILPQLSPLVAAFRDQGFTILSVNYQLMKEGVQLQKPVADVKDAIRWVYKNKDTYNFDTDEIGVLGISSGAHLSLLATYSDDTAFAGDSTLINYSSKVKYIIDVAGPTDLNSLIEKYPNNAVVAGLHEVGKIEAIAKYYSPINYVTSNSPNTLIIHSKNDNMVPYSNSEMLYNKLIELGGKPTLVTLNNSNHELDTIEKEDYQPLIFETLKFIIKNTPI